MIKHLLTFLIGVFAFYSDVMANIGETDSRSYVNWSDYPYVARVCYNDICGTGYFISTIHILTSQSITGCCGVDGNEKCKVFSYEAPNGLNADVVATGNNGEACTDSDRDWVLLEVVFDDKTEKLKYVNSKISRGLTGLKPNVEGGNYMGLHRLGFGDLSVLTADDVSAIKKAYSKWLRKVYPNNIIARDKAEQKGVNLAYQDTYTNIYNEHKDINYNIYNNRPVNEYKTFLDTFQQETGKDFINDYMSDSNRLKIAKDCLIVPNNNKNFSHSCDGWYGDEGSAILTPNNTIVGIADIFNEKIGTNTPNGGFFIDAKTPETWTGFTQKAVDVKQGNSVQEVIYTRADGTRYMKTGGSATWRNNNPGAAIHINQDDAIGPGSKYVGTRYSWAAFPDEETGITEIYRVINLYRENDSTIVQMMHRYAPKNNPKNNPTYYAQKLVRYVKNELQNKDLSPVVLSNLNPDTRLSDIPDEYIPIMAEGIKLLEGWIEGDIIEF